MSSFLTSPFSINGVISTNKTVMQNLNELCTAAGAWMTYDISEGLWSVIINRAGTSVASFTDNNIIGGINVSGSGINELYNKATIEFPHKDLRDQTDYIDLTIPDEDRFPNELDNTLYIRTDLVNNPVQAQYIGQIELKQSRVDKVIEFRTDYSMIGLKAGDLIDVTNSVYDYTNKVFRITRMREEDADDGNIIIAITAIEYDEDIYSTSGLIREFREKKTGIVPKAQNTAITASNNESSLTGLDLTDAAKALGLSLFFVPASGFGDYTSGQYYIDYGGQRVNINASDVVISWTFDTGSDLDIRCRIVSPDVGQNVGDGYDLFRMVGYHYLSATNTPPPTVYTDYYTWPNASTTGSSGTAFLEWGGDNQGAGVEAVRIDIDRIKTVYPSKRYIAVECRGNWYVTPGETPVLLQAYLYDGATVTRQETPLGSGSGSYGFTATGSSKTRRLDGVGVYVDSNQGAGYGELAPGDFMGYFIYDTVEQYGQFVQSLPPGVEQ